MLAKRGLSLKSGGFTVIELLVTIIISGMVALIFVPVLLAHNQKSLPKQRVNNPAALKYVDQRLNQLPSPRAQLNFLALMGCAADSGLIGVYGRASDNPLMQRWNPINSRYNHIYATHLGAGQPSLTQAVQRLCPGTGDGQ
jgi:prepilin-type N-terminal cleavage/methylation domain-containing protein